MHRDIVKYICASLLMVSASVNAQQATDPKAGRDSTAVKTGWTWSALPMLAYS